MCTGLLNGYNFRVPSPNPTIAAERYTNLLLWGVLKKFDSYLASDAPLGSPAERLFQGPIADALAHVGQIAMLRRMAGAPVRGENYFRAEIVVGRIGAEQSTHRVEFD